MFAAQFSLSHACFPYPAAGWLGALVGLPVTLAAFASLALVSTAIALCLGRSVGTGPAAYPLAVPTPHGPRGDLGHDDGREHDQVLDEEHPCSSPAERKDGGRLWTLAQGDAGVTTLVMNTEASRTSISQHLAKLRLTGLVVSRRESRRIVYSMPDGHLRHLVLGA